MRQIQPFLVGAYGPSTPNLITMLQSLLGFEKSIPFLSFFWAHDANAALAGFMKAFRIGNKP